jgi:hypothetical protein
MRMTGKGHGFLHKKKRLSIGEVWFHRISFCEAWMFISPKKVQKHLKENVFSNAHDKDGASLFTVG